MSDNFTIKSYQIPDWLKSFVWEFGGYRCEDVHDVTAPIDRLLIYETAYLKNPDLWHQRLTDNTIETLVVFNDHPYLFTPEVMSNINSLSCVDRLRIFCQGYWSDRQKYSKIVSTHVNFHEHFFSHHFIFQLSRELVKRRKPIKDFLWYTLPKDDYRKGLVQYFQHNDILANSIVSFRDQAKSFYAEADDRVEYLRNKYGEGQWENGIRCYGVGLPNMKAYEQCACEIVLESAESGSWLLSEKFFRPVGFGMPIVLLVGREIFEKIKEYGYRFYDHDDFYNRFQSAGDTVTKAKILEKFMEHIKKTNPAEMWEVADYNYQHFWNHRKNTYYDRVTQAWKRLLGKRNFIDHIYDELDS